MLVFNYHPVTAEYIGTSEADESPLEPGVFLIPAHATEVAPPAPEEGFILRFVDGVWGYSAIEEPEHPPSEEPKPYVPPEISDRQFFQELANRELITEAEAEDAVASGTIPVSLLALVDSLPPEQQFPARMFLKGATRFERSHPMTSAIGTAYGMTPEQIDDLWIKASAL